MPGTGNLTSKCAPISGSISWMVEPMVAASRVVIRDHIRSAPVVPDTLDALAALKVLCESDVPMALVLDEYGHFEGLLTPADILDAIAGAFRSDDDQSESEAVQRDDRPWLLAGWMPADENGGPFGHRPSQ